VSSREVANIAVGSDNCRCTSRPRADSSRSTSNNYLVSPRFDDHLSRLKRTIEGCIQRRVLEVMKLSKYKKRYTRGRAHYVYEAIVINFHPELFRVELYEQPRCKSCSFLDLVLTLNEAHIL